MCATRRRPGHRSARPRATPPPTAALVAPWRRGAAWRQLSSRPHADPRRGPDEGHHPPRGRVAIRRRVRRHPLRDRGRDRQDHDRPAGGPQRVPAGDSDRDLGRPRARSRGHLRRRDRPHRRGAARLLLRWRPARARRHRLPRRGCGRGALPRHRPARADAEAAEADRGHGGGLRVRRRARAARGMRPHDRRRQRALRSDGAPRGVLRRGLRSEPAGGSGRAEEGKGDLVPVPPIRGRGGARHGTRERRGADRGARGGDGALVPGHARALPLRAAAVEGQLQRGRGWPGGHPAARPRRQFALLRERGGARGAGRLPRQAAAGLRSVPAPAVRTSAARGGAAGTLRLWLVAARPRTLPAAVSPVLVGTALAGSEDVFRPLAFAAALVGSVFIQIGTNLSNDYSDARRGADTEDRLGPVRVTAGGLLPPRRVLVGTYVAFAIAVGAGAYLAAVAGWEILLVGVASILAGVLYTGGPRPYGYEGLGELFVFLFFGVVAVAGSYYVQTEELRWEAFALAVPVGLLAAAILVVNNIRDIDTDRRAGKRTLAVKLGRTRARRLFAAIIGASFSAVVALAVALSPWLLLALAALPIVPPLVRTVSSRTDGAALNGALAGSGRLLAVFSVLLAVGVLLS